MSKLWAKLAGIFSSKSFVGIDKAGNRYYKRIEELDGVMKEKRFVTFKREEDPTSIPVEWICWLNGQRKNAPTPEEIAELEARREFVKLNVARLKKEEEERMAKEGKRKATNIGKADGPDLKSFVQQFPDASKGDTTEEASDTQDEKRGGRSKETEAVMCLSCQTTNTKFPIKSRVLVTMAGLQSQLVPVNPLDQEHGNLLPEISQPQWEHLVFSRCPII